MTPIETHEQAERRRVIENARASTEMEGGKTPPEARAIQERWVRGEITGSQLVELSKQLVSERLAAAQSGPLRD